PAMPIEVARLVTLNLSPTSHRPPNGLGLSCKGLHPKRQPIKNPAPAEGWLLQSPKSRSTPPGPLSDPSLSWAAFVMRPKSTLTITVHIQNLEGSKIR